MYVIGAGQHDDRPVGSALGPLFILTRADMLQDVRSNTSRFNVLCRTVSEFRQHSSNGTVLSIKRRFYFFGPLLIIAVLWLQIPVS
jgi:hypothetical protein